MISSHLISQDECFGLLIPQFDEDTVLASESDDSFEHAMASASNPSDHGEGSDHHNESDVSSSHRDDEDEMGGFIAEEDEGGFIPEDGSDEDRTVHSS